MRTAAWAASAPKGTRAWRAASASPGTTTRRSTRAASRAGAPDEEHWREREARGDEDSVDAVEIKIDGAPAAGGWLSSIAGAKRPAARDARGAPEAKTGEAPAGPDAGARSSD